MFIQKKLINKNIMNTKPLDWNDQLINKFWDFYSQFPEEYFTYKYGKNIVDQIATHFARGSNVLDYGCGTGFLIRHFIDKGFDTYGTDSSPKSIDFVNNQYKNSPKFKGAFLLDEIIELDTKFDIIPVIEVIEHLNDEHLTLLLNNIKKLLSPNGKVILTTPNEENLESSTVFCPNCEHTFHRWQHLRKWSKISLSEALFNNGFKVESCYTTDFSINRTNDPLKKVYRNIKRRFISSKKPHLVAVCKM
jgi:2-polyprenyl-3-methyl-5-hydroxy-6-metoxy-1,4-benzoquinol methylase